MRFREYRLSEMPVGIFKFYYHISGIGVIGNQIFVILFL